MGDYRHTNDTIRRILALRGEGLSLRAIRQRVSAELAANGNGGPRHVTVGFVHRVVLGERGIIADADRHRPTKPPQNVYHPNSVVLRIRELLAQKLSRAAIGRQLSEETGTYVSARFVSNVALGKRRLVDESRLREPRKPRRVRRAKCPIHHARYILGRCVACDAEAWRRKHGKPM